jgi:hypothetical protein
MFMFGWIYLHFLNATSPLPYLYAADDFPFAAPSKP